MSNLFGGDSDNALELLRNDHDEAKRLFDQYEDCREEADAATRLEIVESVCVALLVHAQVEQELFYPSLRGAEDADDALDEAAVEHHAMRQLIAQLRDETPGDALYDAKLKVLGEYVRHHVREEEHEIFAKARGADIDLEKLGRRMKARREALMQDPPVPEPARPHRSTASKPAVRSGARFGTLKPTAVARSRAATPKPKTRRAPTRSR